MDINNYINYEGILDELTTNENDYLQYLNSPDDYDLNLDDDKISAIKSFIDDFKKNKIIFDPYLCELSDDTIFFSCTYCITAPNESNGSGEFGGATLCYNRHDEMFYNIEFD
jgi:hypothetical protein